MKRILISMLLLAVSVAFANSAHPITSALGKRLGADHKIDPKAQITRALDGSELYEYTLEQAVPPFTKFYISVTPKTEKIAQIWGVGEFDILAKAREARDKLLSALEERYGKRSSGDRMAQLAEMFGGHAISQGNRYILLLIVSKGDKHEVILRYIDRQLQEQTKHERSDLERQRGREGDNLGESPL